MTELSGTSARILLKAHELFMQYGLRSVSMDDIATALGISKKTIYQYFADKDQLVNEVVGGMIDKNQEVCDFDRSEANDAIHEVFLAMDMVMAMFQSMNPSLLFDMQKYYPVAFQKFSLHKNDYLYGIIRENLTRGIAEELYRSDIKVDVIARFRVESIMVPFHPEFYTKINCSLGEIQQELTFFFLFGLLSPKGYKLTTKYQQDRIKKLTADAKK